jgi:SulP family sulfate permease
MLPGLTAGAVVAVIQISVCLSFSAMIFSGDLTSSLAAGLSGMLIGGCVLNVFAASLGSAPGLSSAGQDGPAAVVAVMAASIAGGLAGGATRGEATVTVMVALALSTLLTGVFFLAFGRLRAGGLVRFIPYPVIGGFLAGTGWLLFAGSVKVMTGRALSPDTVSGLFSIQELALWAPGIFFGVVLFLAKRWTRHFLVFPGLIVAAVVCFYAVLLISGSTVAQADARGYLLSGLPSGSLVKSLSSVDLSSVNWSAVFLEAGNLGTVVVVSLVQFLLYISGLEISIKRDLDLDRELQVAGAANIAAGLGGGIAGFPWPSTSVLAYKMGARTRLVGFAAAGLFILSLFSGASFLPFFPKLILGGLLAYLGLAFLAEWVYDAWFKLPLADYGIVILILVVIGTVGFIEGVAVGLVGAVALFVIKYSRIRVVKMAISGASFRSNRDRSPRHTRILHDKGDSIFILKLQGFIFFGTANSLLQQIKKRVSEPEKRTLRYSVLDFRHVSGLDSSALLSFSKMLQLAESTELRLVFSDLRPEFLRLLEKEGFESTGDEGLFQVYPDLDRAVEWCEEQLLLSEEATFHIDRYTLADFLRHSDASPEIVGKLESYFERMKLDSDHTLIRQGTHARELYFVESGWVTVVLDVEGGKRLRLRTMGAGTVVGETGLYMGAPRTASVITDGPATVHCLTETSLREMETKDPEAAMAFHHALVRHMAERLAQTNRTLEALLD